MGMRSRCKNKNNPAYKRYGAAGIDVCERWDEFENFLRDMGNCPTDGHSIDRIDGNLGYFKENCRWATSKEQARNRSSQPRITFNGVTKTPVEWAEETGLHRKTIMRRIRRGASIHEVLSPDRGKYYRNSISKEAHLKAEQWFSQQCTQRPSK